MVCQMNITLSRNTVAQFPLLRRPRRGVSAALADWICERAGTPMVSTELARVEVVRAARRLDADVVPAARAGISA